MKKTLTFIALGCLCSGPAWADDHDNDDMRRFGPVETFTCNYKDGKGPEDLDKAIDYWSKWADKNEVSDYFAMTVTPVYHGAETFDVGWLGAWPTGASMGSGMDRYMQSGGETAARFNEVLDCSTHSLFATTGLKQPPSEQPPGNLYIAFSDCNVSNAEDWDAVMAGLEEWTDYQAENDYKNGVWMMFPAYGGGDEDFDFKMVNAWDSFSDLGSAFDKYGSGGDWAVNAEMMGDMLSCDASRLYAAKVVRRTESE